MRVIPSFLVLLFLSACTGKKIYEDHSGNFRLLLKNDSSYVLKYPTFFTNEKQRGVYHTENNSIQLIHSEKNDRDSIFTWANTYYPDKPDSVEFYFRNLNDSAAVVSFTINGNPEMFLTDLHGHAILPYSTLLANHVITSDSLFYSFAISYNGIMYHVTDHTIQPKLTRLDFTLNEFIGQKSVIYYRSYRFSNDTITLSGFDPKRSRDFLLLRK